MAQIRSAGSAAAFRDIRAHRHRAAAELARKVELLVGW
jgi:hypothetical protein